MLCVPVREFIWSQGGGAPNLGGEGVLHTSLPGEVEAWKKSGCVLARKEEKNGPCAGFMCQLS